MDYSIILPIYNEAGNLEKLVQKISAVLEHGNYEIIAVNDGSKDKSWDTLKDLALKNNSLKLINLSFNQGQTAAISAGLAHAQGEILIPMDADLENNPEDIPLLLEKLNQGYDVVSGWRKNRWQGKFLSRKLPSILANKLISSISGLKLSDYGCTLKAYRRNVLDGVQLYGEMHRFIPVFAASRGAKVTEVPISYTPRTYGQSNYGISRTYKVILDLLLIKFLSKYMNRPIHFFGGLGFISLFLGTVAGVWAFWLRLIVGKHFVETPLPVFSALFLIIGIQFVLMGVLAEIMMRTYYEAKSKPQYHIKEKFNL